MINQASYTCGGVIPVKESKVMMHFVARSDKQDVRVGINRERLEHARKTPKHKLPQGLSLDGMRNHILAVAEKARQQ